MAISEVYTGSIAVSAGSQFSIVASSHSSAGSDANDGIYQVFLDMSSLKDADVYAFRVFEKVVSGGTQRVVHHEHIAFSNSAAPHYASPSLILIHGWDATLQLVTGSATTIGWSIRKVA